MFDKSNKEQRKIYYVYGHYTNDNKLFYKCKKYKIYLKDNQQPSP